RLFLLQDDAQLPEEGHGQGDAEAAQDLPDGLLRGAREGGLVHLVVGHVAARASRDEDLGTERSRVVDEQYAAPGVRAPRLDGGHEPGRPGAHHGNVRALGHAGIFQRLEARCIMAFLYKESPCPAWSAAALSRPGTSKAPRPACPPSRRRWSTST